MQGLAFRILFLLLCGLAGVLARPLPFATLGPETPAGIQATLQFIAGLGAGGVGLLLEWRLRLLPLRRTLGGIGGLLVGAAVARVLAAAIPAGVPQPEAVQTILYLIVIVSGLMAGAHKGATFQPQSLVAAFRPAQGQHLQKILDTSVIIDGRIADICDTGFVDGTLVVPQFVLRELQFVADSSDALKRNRGRKGLDILQRMKKAAHLNVVFSEMDFPGIREVDQKLIELARHMGAKIVTNDLNLNKVARLRGVGVLNINDLANALRPVILPGETMTVFILKEGKEPNQGVAYLDDGTMVVIDNARRLIGQNVAIMVTSVLQTTAGKMFFGRATDAPTARREGQAREREPERGS